MTRDDALLFSRASHDRNPMHLSEAYARRTPFGQPVVFGVLGALAAIGRLTARTDRTPARIDLEFSNPVFADIDYQLNIQGGPDQSQIHLTDGRRSLVKASITCRQASHGSMAGTDTDAPLGAAVHRTKTEFSVGRRVDGKWSPDRIAFRQLRDRWGLDGKGGDPRHHAALLLASYIVGMDMPGRQALFSRLTLDFDSGDIAAAEEFEYRIEVTSYQPIFNFLVLHVEMRLGGQPFAAGEIRALVRESLEPRAAGRDSLLPMGDGLQGRVALVVGGSRGLGASVAEALARQGCSVLVNFAQSIEEAEQLRADVEDAPGKIVLVQGDASDAASCGRIREQIVRDYGRLDLLVCNASPALLPLWVEPESVERIQEHIARSIGLTLTPLAALAGLLSDSAGWNVLISSVAVRKPVAEWPHYVAAKAALEGLMSTVAIEYPQLKCLIVRPSRLMTDLTNTPLGRKGAIAPAAVAARLVQWILAPRDHTGGGVEYLEDL
jgi:NAD(P)-dependent dehydrogenase (short-subunit alcohol dehydrogenase family)